MVKHIATPQQRRSSINATVHQMHNLISVIIAEAQLLQVSYPQDTADYASAAAIERAGRRLEDLADRLIAAQDEALRDRGELDTNTE